MFETDDNSVAMVMLRNFSRDISIDGDTLRVAVK